MEEFNKYIKTLTKEEQTLLKDFFTSFDEHCLLNKKNKEKLLLESRVTSVIRALAVAYIEENDEIDEEIVTKNVKNIILVKTKEYMSK